MAQTNIGKKATKIIEHLENAAQGIRELLGDFKEVEKELKQGRNRWRRKAGKEPKE